MENIFGDIINLEMVLNQYGEIVKAEWQYSVKIRKEISLDCFQVMPNHFHGIVIINTAANGVGANGRSPLQMRPKSLSSLIAGFKSSVTVKINQLRNAPGMPIWQRNYYEHIIRNEVELNAIRNYIDNNPINWERDKDNLKNVKNINSTVKV